jgi:hypothetical protein
MLQFMRAKILCAMLLLLVMQFRKLSLCSKRESLYLKHTLTIKSIPRCTTALYLEISVLCIMHCTALLSKKVLHIHHMKYSGLQRQCYVINTYDSTESSLTSLPPSKKENS